MNKTKRTSLLNTSSWVSSFSEIKRLRNYLKEKLSSTLVETHAIPTHFIYIQDANPNKFIFFYSFRQKLKTQSFI